MTTLSTRQKVTILGSILMGLFLASINSTSVVTAMPRVVASLGGMHLYSWVFASYMLGTTCAIPIFGKLSDLLGRRPVFVAGLALFTVASALNGLSQNMEQLVLFRGIQGLAAGAITPLVMIVMGDLFAPAERARFQGATSGLWAIASAIGPLMGGYFVDNWNWRLVFFFNVPLGMLTTVVAFYALRDLGAPSRKRPIDYAGMATLTAGVTALLLGLLLGGTEYPWASPPIIGLFGLSAAMLSALIMVERSAEEPIIPLSLFRNAIFTISASATFISGFSLFGATTFTPLLLQAVLGTSATDSGLMITPQALGLMAGSTVGGFMIARLGYRVVIWAGTFLLAAGLYLMTLIGLESQYGIVVFSMAVLGFGWGASGPTIITIVQNTAEHAQIGIATSSVQFCRQIGATIGVTAMGTVLNLRLGPAIRSRLPAGLAETLPVRGATGALDPGSLLDPGKAAGVPPDVLEAVRSALAASIHEVFFLAMGVTIMSLFISLFLKEVPLKKEWRANPPEEATTTPPLGPHLHAQNAARQDQ